MYIELTLATLFGGTSGGLVYFFTKTYFTEKIKGSIKAEYDSELENLRSELTRNNNVINSVLSSQNQTFQVGQAERLNAIKKFWISYLIIRNTLTEINSIDEILLEEEFNDLYTSKSPANEQLYNTLNSTPKTNPLLLHQQLQAIEEYRPFLNEEIWLNIVYLRTFSGRVIYLYNKGCNEKKVAHWKNDSALMTLVKDALTEKEFEFIKKSNSATIKKFQNFMEQKILTEISNIVTGQIAADKTYSHALRLIELTNAKS